jgi:putative glutamine amidotransferase
VNSVHHQGVKKIGHNLKVDAHCSEDGLVEAFHYEGPEPVFFQGVQWHPEFSHTLGDRIIDPAPLLDRFLKEIRS